MAAKAAAVLVSSFLLGVATWHLQSVLPAAFASFANSCSGWTLLTVALLLAVRPTALGGAVLGAASFVLLVWGYTAAAPVYNPVVFTLIGLLAGPFVGASAVWIRSIGLRAATATSVLSGIAIGDAVYGLTIVGDTTGHGYWILIAAIGAMSLAISMVRLRARPVAAAIALVGTGIIAGGYWGALGMLGTRL